MRCTFAPVVLLFSAIALFAVVPPAGDIAAHAAGGSDRISPGKLDKASLCGIGRGNGCSVKIAIARGLFQTGLRPNFSANARCRDIDEHWAIDYTYKRNRESYHGGIDMPAPFGTPILAAAAGTVVGVYSSGDNSRGIQVILRHTPEDTGIPLWIYTVYAHLQRMPKLSVGNRLRMGDVIGPTGNTGRLGVHKGGRRGDRRQHDSRRPAVHFAVYFSAGPKYASLREIVIPVDGYWMDPVALFRAKPPFDSKTMTALPASQKKVPIPYMLANHEVFPAGSKLIWPYTCTRR
jgi:murein DD-endopeptidase MepM/ murein hydrolase activator NlpD